MRNKIILALVILGVLAGVASAYVSSRAAKPLPPVFNPAANPYADGIFANGIIESYQRSGENQNIYPEVSGTVREILVSEGDRVTEGTPLLVIDDSIQRATAEQQVALARAASAMLQELKEQPRPETLEVARAQVGLAAASLKGTSDTLAKQQKAFDVDPRTVSKDVLDTDRNAVKIAQANLDVLSRQLQLTKAGAWIFDIQNQERQYMALTKAAASSNALLGKYTLRASVNGTVLAIQAALGSFVSPQGSYDTYTQGFDPVAVMGTGDPQGYLGVRCYVDEILIPKLPAAGQIQATMFVRGTTTKISLEFVRFQPYVSPKIELSDARLEKVDLRVLPIIFRFRPPPAVRVYPGEMVDVYVGGRPAAANVAMQP